MLFAALSAAEIDAFAADIMDVGVADGDVRHPSGAVIVGLDEHAGKADPGDLQPGEFEVGGAASHSEAGAAGILEGVVDEDPVSSLGVGIAVGMSGEAGISGCRNRIVLTRERPVRTTADDHDIARKPETSDPNLAACVGNHQRVIGGA